MKRIPIAIIALTLICAFNAVQLWAQATAQISGTVKDQSGAVLPGVEITATQTVVARSAVTTVSSISDPRFMQFALKYVF